MIIVTACIFFATISGCLFYPLADTISELERVNCHPEPFENQETCEQRRCIWDGSDLEIPSSHRCYYPPETGYKIMKSSNQSYFLVTKIGTPSPYGAEVKQLEITVRHTVVSQFTEKGTVNVKITDPLNERFVPPVPLVNQPYPYDCFNEPCDELIFQNFTKSTSGFFSFKILRKSSSEVIFDTSLGGLIYSDQFLQIATFLPSRNVYGFGENVHKRLKHNLTEFKTWPMFTRDEFPISTEEQRKNLYGVHPFYLCVESDGNAHGVFFFNSNAQEYTLGPGPGYKGTLTYRTIGGILDMYFFPGPKPEQVIQQYLSLIGRPVMPAYWALGFGLSRWGYKNLTVIKEVLERNREAGMPQDFQVFDIDYMDRYKDFTHDPVRFPDMNQWVKKNMHDKGVKLVTILDPAIDVNSATYKPLQDGLEKEVFISWPNSSYVTSCLNRSYPLFVCPLNKNYATTRDTNIMLGTVWPDHNTAFPDFLDPKTSQWWIQHTEDFYKNIVEFDGLWIDMNEPANFGTNEARPWYFDKPDHPNVATLFCPENPLDSPPYETWAVYHYENSSLATKTLCMVAKQGTLNHYDVHSLYGWSEAVPTQQAVFSATGKRGSVITRSTFASSGRYGGHWLGDNAAQWDDLQTSLIGSMEFNFFGIPYIGADICGFFGNATEELCLRWQQAGAFYTFFRNHNGFDNVPQDPAMWASVALAASKAARFRYRYLPYLYTLFYHSYLQGHTVIRPLFFEYPRDSVALEVDRQFLWGDSFLISPVLDPGVDTVEGYIPQDIWYSIYDFDYGQKVAPGWATMQAPNNSMIPVHVRGGRIFPRQEPQLTTAESRKNPLELLIAPDAENKAAGFLYWDDGETIAINNTEGFENFFYFSFKYRQEYNVFFLTIKKHSDGTSAGVTVPSLDIVEIFDFPSQPEWSTFYLNDNPLPAISHPQSTYNATSRIFHLKTNNFVHLETMPLNKEVVLSWVSSPIGMEC